MFSNSNLLPPSRIRSQTPTRTSRITASSPTPSRSNTTSSRHPMIRPASSMSMRTPIRAGQSANATNPKFNSFTTPSRPASSLSNVRPTTPSFNKSVENSQQTYCGTVKVSVRPRPLPTNSPSGDWELDTLQNTITSSDLGEFQYDHVYEPLSNNYDVYCQTVKPIVDKCLDGFNGTIFAYGMTGSGKTHSMQGSEYEAGLIQLAVNEMYERMEFEQDKKIYTVTLSYLEIYNEKLYDLLNPETSNLMKSSSSFKSSTSSSPLVKEELKIRGDPIYGVNIVGLRQQTVQSPDELLTYISKGDSIRRTGGTDFNARSSRSHAIVMIRLKSLDISAGTEKFSTLSLCDLAGSEKATTQHERRKEGAYINKSLLALSTVISKLSAQSLNNSSSSQAVPSTRTHIPYRDSKLTRLLQSSLSGSSVISILCTIHLSHGTAPETINTLRFAARAKNIQLTVKKNEANLLMNSSAEKDKIIQNLKNELDKYKKKPRLVGSKFPGEIPISPVSSNNASRQSSLDSSTSSNHHLLSKSESSKFEEQLNQLQAENRILTEQVEHYKRLNDYSRLNSTIVKNEYVQSLSSLEINKNYEDVHEIVVGLEDFYKKQMIEIEELSSYKNHLENMLKRAELSHGTTTKFGSEHLDVASMTSTIKDQEEELLDLKEQLSSKNAIIQALKNSNKVRESLTSNSSSKRSRIPSLSQKRSDESMRSSNDIYSDMNLSSEMNSSVILPNADESMNVLRPVADDKLNHSMLNSSPLHKQLEVEDSW